METSAQIVFSISLGVNMLWVEVGKIMYTQKHQGKKETTSLSCGNLFDLAC